MLGAWSTFGNHPLPKDGAAIVVILVGTPVNALFGASRIDAVPAIYREGMLLMQDGRTMSTPFGCEWTALPPPSMKAIT